MKESSNKRSHYSPAINAFLIVILVLSDVVSVGVTWANKSNFYCLVKIEEEFEWNWLMAKAYGSSMSTALLLVYDVIIAIFIFHF